ncbi:MOSC domain-containing protein [Roseibium sp.]|uniref:MOSC domain-containing protein n=1 Tax=Roseibium sp. TaxID=1936156 RepID=UPI0032660321
MALRNGFTMTGNARILGLYQGQPEHRWQGKDPSAIRKIRADGPLRVTITGLAEDRQADRTAHGGPDMALHAYPSEHYAHWRETFPGKAAVYAPGGFGENLSTEGLTEAGLCIGDVFSAGTARLQVTQGRQPCWKLNMHTDNPAQAAAFRKTARTGWYLRVLEEGVLEAGDEMGLVDRPCPHWSLREVIFARFNPQLDPATASALAGLEELGQPWRTAFARKADPESRTGATPALGD